MFLRSELIYPIYKIIENIIYCLGSLYQKNILKNIISSVIRSWEHHSMSKYQYYQSSKTYCSFVISSILSGQLLCTKMR